MTLRLQNLMLAMLLALTTLFVGFGTLSQNPASGGYQLFEPVALEHQADIQLASLENFASPPETASEYANAPNRTPQVTINRQNGAEFEQQVIDALGPVGGVKNTTPQTVTLSNGTVVTTIPDLWGRNVGGLLEAKNVQDLSRSPQLQAQAEIARRNGEPMNLIVSPRTQSVSGPLLEDVRSTGGDVFIYNPLTDSISPWPK